MTERTREVDELAALAKEQGWRVEPCNNGHMAFYPPDKTHSPIYTGRTPSDWRANRNLRAQLRRAGLVLPGREAKSEAAKFKAPEGHSGRCPHDGAICEEQTGCDGGGCARLNEGRVLTQPREGYPLPGYVEVYEQASRGQATPYPLAMEGLRAASEIDERLFVPEVPEKPARATAPDLDPSDLLAQVDALLEMRASVVAQLHDYRDKLLARRAEIDALVDETERRLGQLQGLATKEAAE